MQYNGRDKMELIIEDNLDFNEYKYLRNTTTWAHLSDAQITNLIEHSTFKVRARIDGKTVAMGRALFDFGYNAFFTVIVVAPEFQGQGIGKNIVERLIKRVKDSLSDTDFIQFNLMAAPGKSGFYEKLGFYKREESNGFGMVMRINAN